jgi:hypothetical protein
MITLAAIPTATKAQVPWMAGDAIEEYLRVRAISGSLGYHQWTLRGFGPREFDAMDSAKGPHPWQRHFVSHSRTIGRIRWGIDPAVSRTDFNSTFAYGYNDGALWFGKGITQSLVGGIRGRLGVLSVRLSPLVYWSQNADFPTLIGGPPGPVQFRDPRYGGIDLPQRYGADAFTRIDPGQSEVRVDIRSVSAGVSTTNEIWGPAVDNPLILGNNAPGIPRAFVGTARPMGVGIGSMHTRMLWGVLRQSGYAAGDTGKRYVTALVGSFSPRGVPSLEIGAARFFHVLSIKGDIPPNFFFRTVDGLLKESVADSPDQTDDPADNQLASIFFRWAFPHSGIEVYGEFAREDHSFNARDLAGQPDHDAAYTIGLQRLWTSADSTRYSVLSLETMNARISHLNQALPQGVWYVHDYNGHTQFGQILGAPAAPGGGSSSIRFTRYFPTGASTFRLGRIMVAERSDSRVDATSEILHELEWSRTKLSRPSSPDMTLGATAVFRLNSPFESAGNFNLRTVVRLSFGGHRHVARP